MKNLAWVPVAIVLIMSESVAHGQDKLRERDVSVTGHGSIMVRPDEVRFKVGVETDGASLEAGRRENGSKMNALMNALKDAGVPEADMVTSDTSLRKSFTPAQHSKTKKDVTSFTFNRTVAVRLRNLEIAADVLAGAVKAGANSVSDFAFIDSKRSEHLEAARTLAIEDALRTADQMARGFGAKRGKITSIRQRETDRFSEPDRTVVTGSLAPQTESEPEVVASFAVGEIKVETSVDATFELE